MESKIQNSLIQTSNGYKLVCVDDKFSKSFKAYLGEDAISDLIWPEKNDIKMYSTHMKENLLLLKDSLQP